MQLFGVGFFPKRQHVVWDLVGGEGKKKKKGPDCLNYDTVSKGKNKYW